MAEEQSKGRRPDFRVSAYNKVTQRKGEIGAAWRNDNGSINIVLTPCVVIDPRLEPDLLLSLWPVAPERD